MLLDPFDREISVLLQRINGTVLQTLSRYAARYGITWSQALVLMALYQQDGQSLRTLCQQVACQKSNLSPLCKRLEQAGYVSRIREEEDQRVVRIFLTERGRSLVEDCIAHRDQLCLISNSNQRQQILTGLRTLDELLRSNLDQSDFKEGSL